MVFSFIEQANRVGRNTANFHYFSHTLKWCLHYGKNHARLADFKNAKYFFCSLKRSSLARFLSWCKWAFVSSLKGIDLKWDKENFLLLLTIVKIAFFSLKTFSFYKEILFKLFLCNWIIYLHVSLLSCSFLFILCELNKKLEMSTIRPIKMQGTIKSF